MNLKRYACIAWYLPALCATTPALATNYWVGAGCTYTNIPAAINAALATSGSYPVIYVSTNQTYSNQAISIAPGSQQSHLTLHGGVAGCNTTTTSGATTLTGGASAAVLTVRGAMHVTLSHLTITGGHGDNGGGIDFSGTGGLNIDNSTITDNHANNGAGIRFVGAGGTADLYLNASTFVTDNVAAHTGGGIRADEQASVHIDAEPIWISGNQAGDNGGGVAVVGGAYAHIGSPGYLFSGPVYGNIANYGGGIAVIAESTGSPRVDIFATDPTRPVRIEQNGAYRSGGGIYLVSYASTVSEFAELFLGGAQIDHNVAQEGSSVYADTTSIPGVYVGSSVYVEAGHCAAGVECNTMSNNQAQDIANGYTATTGSTLLLQTESTLQAHALTMRGNEGAHAIRVADSLTSPLVLDTCLLAGNSMTAELVTLGNASASLNQCTIANNSISGVAILRANADFTLTNSIIAQGSYRTLYDAYSGATLNLDYVMSLETASLSAGTHIMQADPGFVDPGNGDFHLRLNGPAVDVAPAGNAADHDLDNWPRDQDLPEVPDIDGPRDLGAYERQLSACDVGDTVFCNGFEP